MEVLTDSRVIGRLMLSRQFSSLASKEIKWTMHNVQMVIYLQCKLGYCVKMASIVYRDMIGILSVSYTDFYRTQVNQGSDLLVNISTSAGVLTPAKKKSRAIVFKLGCFVQKYWSGTVTLNTVMDLMETSQELRMLSSVTINCQVRMIV